MKVFVCNSCSLYSMGLSTDLDCSGGLPGRVPSSRKLSQAAIVSYGQLCRGEWEARVPNPHRPHDVTINLCALDLVHLTSVGLTRLPYQRSLIEVRVWLSCATTGCVSRETSNRTMDLLQKHKCTGSY